MLLTKIMLLTICRKKSYVSSVYQMTSMKPRIAMFSVVKPYVTIIGVPFALSINFCSHIIYLTLFIINFFHLMSVRI